MVAISRTIFLTYPLRWRDYLGVKKQITSFVYCIIFAIFISSIPFFGICSLANVRGKCLVNKDGSISCKIYFLIYLLSCQLGPSLVVITSYVAMARLVWKANLEHEALAGKQSRNPVKSSNGGYREERRKYPWSILAILLLNITSVVPWSVVNILAKEILTDTLQELSKIVVDVFYSLMFIAMSASPVVYIISTETIKRHVLRILSENLIC